MKKKSKYVYPFGLGKIMICSFLIAATTLQSGCIIFLTATAVTISKMRGSNFHTASVVVKGDAKATFNQLLDAVKTDYALNVLKTDFTDLQADFEKNGQHGSLKVIPVDNRQIQIISTVDSGQADDAEDWAVRIVTRACELLGVEYKTIDHEIIKDKK